MDKAILLAVVASVCTATASLCQRKGAKDNETAGFDARLIVRLARQPAWLLGIAAMIGGFAFQLTALRFGELALVQPILAAELLFVFGYLAVAGSRRPKLRDWLAAAAMSAGIGVFLRLAAPSGGRLHAPGSSWLLAGLITAGVLLAAPAAAFGLGGRPARGVLVRRAHPDRRGRPGRRGAGAGRGHRRRHRPEPQLPYPRRKPAPGLPGSARHEPARERPRSRAGHRGPAVTPGRSG